MTSRNPFEGPNGALVREHIIDLVTTTIDTADAAAFWRQLDALQRGLPTKTGKDAVERLGNTAAAWVFASVTLAVEITSLVLPHLAAGTLDRDHVEEPESPDAA